MSIISVPNSSRILVLLPLTLSLVCTKPTVKLGYDFSSLGAVAIGQVNDAPGRGGSGKAVGVALAHHLMRTGLNVVERPNLSAVLEETALAQSGASDESGKETPAIRQCDAVMICSVTDFSDQKVLLIPVEIVNKGSTVSIKETEYPAESDSTKKKPRGKIISQEETRHGGYVTHTKEIRYVKAVVGVALQLVEVETGYVIWSSTYTYSALRRADALSRCLEGALKPLRKILLRRRPH